MENNIVKTVMDKLVENVSKVIVGKDEQIALVSLVFLCGGHALLEDLPGTGKTMLLRAFAKSVGGDFKRIQFTPDVQPSDVTGINFYNMKSGEFEFRKGPIFANIVLGDEINRASPRTQSALLEAMAEKQVTVDGVAYPLASPFMVVATENPLESFGTFPLPEAQLDRFMMKLSLGYMTKDEELSVARRINSENIIETLDAVCREEDFLKCTEYVAKIECSAVVEDYLMAIVDESRNNQKIRVGVSTRGVIALYRMAKMYAAYQNRMMVIPEDVKYLAPYILSHRVVYRDISDSKSTFEAFQQIVDIIAVPLEEVE